MVRTADGGGGGGGGSIDTRVDGNPENITQVASWLRDTYDTAVSGFSDEVFAARSSASSAWEGDAGEKFGAQLKATGSMGDDVSSSAGKTATILEGTAASLTTLKEAMRRARQDAGAADLEVSGTVIVLPAPPPDVPDLPAGATEAEASAHREKVARVEAWNTKAAAFDDIVGDVDAARTRFDTELETDATSWYGERANLASVFTNAVSAGLEGGLGAAYGAKFATMSQAHLAEAGRLRNIALDKSWTPPRTTSPTTALGRAIEDVRVREGGVLNPKLANDLLNRADSEKAASQVLDDMAKKGTLPPNVAKAVKGGGVVLAGVGTGYGIYADIQDGESVEQAVVSNGGGLAASIGAGAATGAVLGSVVPGLGTGAGLVIGAGVGTVAGIITSGAIDSMWENGVDNIGDVGSALWDGVKDVGDTGAAIGGLAADAGEGIADGAKKVWGAIF